MRIDRKRVITTLLTTAMVIGLATSVKAEIIPGCEACKIRYGYAVPMKKTSYYATNSHCLYGHNTIYVYECNNHPKDHAKVESCSTCGFKIK